MTPEDLEQIRAIVAASEHHTIEAMRDMQTELLKGLERFARGNYARFGRLEASEAADHERISALEERVTALETRPPKQ